MAFTLEQVVPWGRCLEEYKDMFLLTPNDLRKNIVGIGDGPASFNYEASLLGANVTSIDPIYQFSKKDIKNRINETYNNVMEQLESNQNQFVWNKIKSPKELGETRLNSMKMFLNDFEAGLKEKRYISDYLPNLSLADNSFNLALVSHFLFLYSNHLDLKFHVDSIIELMRISDEARIFPLVKLDGNKSEYIEDVQSKFNITIVKTNYQFQRGADEMMIIKKS